MVRIYEQWFLINHLHEVVRGMSMKYHFNVLFWYVSFLRIKYIDMYYWCCFLLTWNDIAVPHVTPSVRVIGVFPSQCASNWGFDIFFDVILNIKSKKRHCNIEVDEDVVVVVVVLKEMKLLIFIYVGFYPPWSDDTVKSLI